MKTTALADDLAQYGDYLPPTHRATMGADAACVPTMAAAERERKLALWRDSVPAGP